MMSLFQNVSSCYKKFNLKRNFAFLIVLLSAIPFDSVQATHSSGADLQYRWISGRTYEITITFYRDCAGVAAPSSLTLNALSSTCSQNQNYTINLVAGSGQEITFPCRSSQTLCTNSGSALSGYEQYLYRNNITLPQNCPDWILSFYICCRNCAITTLNNPCTENLYIEATLNNVVAPANSSPRFTNIPVAFICVNQEFTYNHGVIDPNGDSLVYSFVDPKTYNTTTFTVGNVPFNPGYSATAPLTSSPAVAINSSNGDITMTPTANGEIGVTAILVEEYRNGVKIGSVIRDMQFITRVCNPNFIPDATGMNGVAVFDTTVCAGSSISFTVNSADLNPGDSVFMTWNNGIPGATFITSSAQFPQGTFAWTPSAGAGRSQPYTFIISVRDNACPLTGSQTYSYSVFVPLITTSVTSSAFNGFNVACRGGSTATATVTGSGGDLPYQYSWNPSGQTTQTATGLSAGNYIATITDVHGCTGTSSINITQPPTNDSITLSSVTNVSCNGGNNGSITVTGSGGISPYTYSWSNGQTTATATGLSNNNYTVTLTDQNNCTTQRSILVTEPTAMNAAIASFQNVTCQGNANGVINTTVSGGTGPYTHSWSNGSTSDTLTGLPPATYSDTVRDSKGCTQIITQIITEPGSGVSIPSSSVSTINVSCFGFTDGEANVNPSGGTLPYVVTWSNGDVGNSADTLASGNYTAYIVDGNGCTFDTTITITQPLALSSAFINVSSAPSGNQINCKGDTTGRATVVPSGGTAPYTFLWSSGETIDLIINAPADTYYVDITDTNNCFLTDTIIFTEPIDSLNDSLLVKHVGCQGESSGGIRAVTFGGSPSYLYTWDHGPINTDTVGNLIAGFYRVTIIDTNGCQKIDTVTIQEPTVLVPLILPSTYIDSVNVTCYGDSTGQATLNVDGGTRPFTYLWSQNSVDSFATGLPAGVVTVLVVDSNGCSAIRSVTLSQPLPFFYGPDVNDPLCYGDSSGYIVLNTSGSTPPYIINWSNGQTGDSAVNFKIGTYYVIVEDANNCQDSLTFTLNQLDSITVNANISDFQGFNVSCNGDSSAYIALHPTGGAGVFQYLWSNSATTDSIGNLQSGTYSVTITDANGCTQDTTITLNQPTVIDSAFNISIFNGGSNVSCFGYIDGVAHVVASGGVPPYTYLWSNGDVADSALGLAAGFHSVIVTDSNGCSLTFPFSLTEPTPVAIAATLSNFNGYNVGCFGDSTACITISASGGNGPYQYLWEPQDLFPDSNLCNLPADTFSVIVADANGCQIDTSFILTTPPPLNNLYVLSNFNGYEIQCDGMSNGSINVTVAGGVLPYTYDWSNLATTQDISGLDAGTYQLIINDANGCEDSLSATLDEPAALISSVSTLTDLTCFGVDDGTVTLTPASGGTSPYTYNWSNGDTGLMSDSLSSGSVSVTIADVNGCTQFVTATIDEPTAMTINTTSTAISCDGAIDGRASASVSGGTGPYSFSWLPSGNNDSVAVNLSEGIHTINVTDLNSCLITATVTIAPGDCDFELPSGFSPNGDGYNDFYVIHGLTRYPENIFKVFNRWGNEVFSSNNFRNDQWHGQNDKGEDLPDGTYFVSFVVKNSDVKRNTFVDLRR